MGDFFSVLQTSVTSLALLFYYHSSQPWASMKVGTKGWPAQSPNHTRASMIHLRGAYASFLVEYGVRPGRRNTVCLHRGGKSLGLKQ